MRKALLIGINNYPGNELSGCINDVDDVKSAIEYNGDGSKNFDIETLLDIYSRADALMKIQELFSQDDDFALLYFSGHGCELEGDGVIVFPDHEHITMSNIIDIANKSNVKNKVIILDCCHSGHTGITPGTSISNIGKGVSILTACREKEYSVEINGHGAFTEMLCSALTGSSADFCGNITIAGVYAYIDRSFGAWQQRPTFKTNVNEFAPIKKVIPKVSILDLKKLTEFFENERSSYYLDPSYEFTNIEGDAKAIEPYAILENVEKFKLLQKYQSIGLVEPVGEEYLYFAAMNSKSCRLTTYGKYYWNLAKFGRL